MKTIGCLIFFLASTIYVTGNNSGGNNNSEDQGDKQHIAGPRGAGFCGDVCDDIRKECSSTCYPPTATARTIFSSGLTRGLHNYDVVRDDSEKYECFNICLHPNNEPIMIDQSSCVAVPESTEEDEESDEVSDEEKNEIKLANLTMKKRCELPAFKNSTVCRLEAENPSISKQVFVTNRAKLTLCPGGQVLSGDRGLYTNNILKSFMQRQDQLAQANNERNPAKRSVWNEEEEEAEEEEGGLVNRIKRSWTSPPTEGTPVNKRKGSKWKAYKPRPNSAKETKEFCRTRRRIESRGSATHVGTQRQVSLYFYGPYSQWYETGECIYKTPVEGTNFVSHCAVTETAHKVWIMVDDNEENRKLFNDCFPQKGSKYLVCHDWVLIPTHCKHYMGEAPQ